MKTKITILAILLIFCIISVNAQIKFNRNIPNEAHEIITKLLPKGINSFSFSPNGGWLIVTKTNETFARNIPDACYKKIQELKNKGHKIKQVSFPPQGGDNSWLIITNQTTFARNIPNECHKKIQELKNNGKKIKSVSFPYKNAFNDSKNSWIIVTNDGSTYSRNIPDECYQIIRNLKQSDMPNKRAARKITQVSFSPSGGWVILADDYFFARNIPNEAFDQLNYFDKKKYKSNILAFTPNGKGWSLIANEEYYNTPKDLIKNFENNVSGKSIWKAMRENNVPGVSIAVVINGEIAWKTAYGHLKKGDYKHAVHPESMFQAASVSKFITAIGAYNMTESFSSIDLDDDIRDPNSQLSVIIPIDKKIKKFKSTVSIRNILNHCSGINKQGYDGYSTSVGKVPNLDEIIIAKSGFGKTPVNSRKITIVNNDSISRYSGAAFTILQKLMEDVTKKSFSSWMKTQILNPMGMTQSRFTINPEEYYKEDNLTWGYIKNHIRNRYPEYAAAGLYTNAEDLANVIKMLTSNGRYNNKTIINSANLSLLQIGNGAKTNYSQINAKNSYFGHGGTNEGYRALLLTFPEINTDDINNAGIVILFNGANTQFRYDLVNAIIKAYDW